MAYSSEMIRYWMIGKGVNPADAEKFSKLDWISKIANGEIKLPPGLPPLNGDTIAAYKQQAKAAGVSLEEYAQQKLAPSTIQATPPGPAVTAGVAAAGQAAQQMADIAQPTAPPTIAGPTPPAGAAPAAPTPAALPPAAAAPAAPQSQLYHKPYALTPADTSDAVVNKIYNESDKKGPASYGPVIGSGINRLDSEGRGPSSTLKDVFFSMGHDGKHQQYTAPTTPAPPEAAAQIRQQIAEQASGTVPNPAGNATDYLFAGASKSWIDKNNAQQIGGNWYVPKGKNIGAYADASPINPAETQVAANELAPSLPDRKPADIPQPQMASNAALVGGAPTPNVTFSNQGAKRPYPIDPMLQSQLDKTAGLQGLKVDVFSGGQEKPFINNSGKLTSHRHDIGEKAGSYSDIQGYGGAADIHLIDPTDGHVLTMDNPADAERMAQFTQEMVSEGETGVGAGNAYMGPDAIHIGGGKTATWGGAKWIGKAQQAGLATPPIPSRNPNATAGPAVETAATEPTEAPAPPPAPPLAAPAPPATEPAPAPAPQDLSTDWAAQQFTPGDFGPPTPPPQVGGAPVLGGAGGDFMPPQGNDTLGTAYGAPVLGGAGSDLTSGADSLGPLIDPSMPLPTRNPGVPAAPPIGGFSVTGDSFPPQAPGTAGWMTEPPSPMGVEQPPQSMFSIPGTNAVDALPPAPAVQNFSGGYDQPPMVGGAPSPFSTGGPPGTVASPTDPKTFIPSLQTQSSINQTMSPFNPMTAPTLGAPTLPPNAPGLNVSGSSGFPDMSSLDQAPGWMPPLPNQMQSPFQYAPPFPSLTNPPSAANLMAPGPDMLSPGLPTPYQPKPPTPPTPTPTAGFDPTQGAPGVGGVPSMPSWAIPGAFGMGPNMPLGGIESMQFAGGTSAPTSMAASTGQYGGVGFNPATAPNGGIMAQMGPTGMFAPGGTNWADRMHGGVGGGPISQGASLNPAGTGPASSPSMESHALQLMQSQDTADQMNFDNLIQRTISGKGPPQMMIGGSDVMGLTGGIGMNRQLANMWEGQQRAAQSVAQSQAMMHATYPIRPYGMNVGFGPSFGSRF